MDFFFRLCYLGVLPTYIPWLGVCPAFHSHRDRRDPHRIFCLWVHFSKQPAQLGLARRKPGAGSCFWVSPLKPSAAAFPGHEQGMGSDVEQPEHELAPIGCWSHRGRMSMLCQGIDHFIYLWVFIYLRGRQRETKRSHSLVPSSGTHDKASSTVSQSSGLAIGAVSSACQDVHCRRLESGAGGQVPGSGTQVDGSD